MTIDNTFKGYARERLASVEETVQLFSGAASFPQATGPAFLPLSELLDEAERLGESHLARECDLMLNQVMNLFQADFPQRPILAKAITRQARTIEDLLAV